jgi:hypothetical protein
LEFRIGTRHADTVDLLLSEVGRRTCSSWSDSFHRIRCDSRGASYVRCLLRQPNGVAFAPIANVRRKVRSQTKEHVFPPIPQQRSLAWDANPEPDIAKYKVYWGLQSGVPSEPFDVGNNDRNYCHPQ